VENPANAEELRNESAADYQGRSERSPQRLGVLVGLLIPLYAIHTVWYQLISFGTVFSSTLLPNVSVEQMAMEVTTIVGCLLLIVFDRIARRNNNTLTLMLSAVSLLGATFLILSANQTLVDQHLMAAVGALLIGFGYAWLFLSMFRVFKSHGTMWEFVIVLVISNAAASITVGAALVYLPNSVLFGVILICILLNGILLWQAQKAVHIDQEPRLPGTKTGLELTGASLRSFKSLRNAVILLVVLSLAVSIMRSLNASLPWENTRIVATWFNDPWAIVTEIAAYIVVGLLLFYAVTHRINELWSQAPFFVMLAGLLGLFFMRAEYLDTQGYTVYSMTMEWLFQLTYIFTLVSIMRVLPLTTFQIVGTATAVITLLSVLKVFALDEVYSAIGLVIIGAVYLLAIFLSSLRRDNPEAVIEAEAQQSVIETPQQTLAVRVAEVARKGSLTERETEILALLVQGHNLQGIQKELVVANDTVRTHVKHIYRKLDVHTRQELISLFLQ